MLLLEKFQNEGWLTGRNFYSPHGKYVDRIPVGTDLSTYETLYGERIDLSLPYYTADTVIVQGQEYLEIRDNGTGDSSLVNMNHFETQSFQGNLEFKPLSWLKFNLIGTYAQEEGGGFDFGNRFVPNGMNNTFRNNYSLNFKTTISPSANIYYCEYSQPL